MQAPEKDSEKHQGTTTRSWSVGKKSTTRAWSVARSRIDDRWLCKGDATRRDGGAMQDNKTKMKEPVVANG
ncbi:hypothetical protein U1Q18_042746, partial [Sarracenia purpurea var. burkii]